jgi:CRP-like cAMP-binding protein/glyoxylase-like metal-dependent hydrolase (beta-lactamase superfamily II)
LERLPRGGALLETSAGRIQFGAVPETIKDTLGTASGVPRIFVLPPKLVSLERGVSFADLEFPVYFNFFALAQRVTVICDEAQREILSTVLREAIFGPERIDMTLDQPAWRATRTVPDLEAELAWFRKHPRKPGARIELEDLVEFVAYDAAGTARLGEVCITRRGETFEVADGGVVIAEIGAELKLPPLAPEPVGTREPFIPPYFGMTFIGAGHGFDPTTKTSGFILWVNGRGIMVDPPVDSIEWLTVDEVSPKYIDSLILTHCHADHDSGALQKILEEGRIKVYTTRTIMGSFERKYRTLLGLDKRRWEDLFDFVPVTVGEPIRIAGGEFWFQYTLHSVPCIGFECFFGGKSMVYTSDTLYDPTLFERLYEEGVLSAERRDELLNFPWHHDFVIHEAGVPPIHTQAETLAALPDDVKDHLWLVHTNPSSLPAGSNLRVAATGLDQTLVIEAQSHPTSEAIDLLQILSKVDLFKGFTLDKAAEFLGMVQRVSFKAGEQIIAKGSAGDRFYMIASGKAAVRDGLHEVKHYGPYDYIGETAIILDQPRNADVFATTDLTALALDRHDFLYFVRGSGIVEMLRRLAAVRLLDSWELLDSIDAFGSLTATQKTMLQTLMVAQSFEAGEVLAAEGDLLRACFLVIEGEVEVSRGGEAVATIVPGSFLGEVNLLYEAGRLAHTYRAKGALRAYRLPKRELVWFLKKNPGVYVRLAALAHGA